MELEFYEYLLKQEGITKITLQPKLVVFDKFERDGKKYREITYAPDFLVEYTDGSQCYFDAKGMSTQQGDMRRKMYLSRYPTELRWVTKNIKWSPDGSGWIDYDLLQKLRKNNKKTKEA
jgi:hypothetical protein